MSALPAPALAAPAELVIARQAIVDRHNAVVGYALMDGSGAPPDAARDAQLLLQAVTLSGESVIGDHRLLFVRCSWESVMRGCLALVDPERVVIDLPMPEPDPEIARLGLPTLVGLRERGFRFAMSHDAIGSAWREWVRHASFLKIELSRLPEPAHAAIVKVARALPAELRASGINDHATCEQARALGLEMLQGSWFASPVPVQRTTLRPNQAVIVQLISLLRRQADVSQIEALLKKDAALSLALLQLLNGGFCLASEVTSFREAVMLLGMQRVLRWATVLLATSSVGTPVLAQSAVVRGRLMELLAIDLMGADHGDPAFVVGVFSFMEALTGAPLSLVMEGLALPADVEDALLHGTGTYAPLLALAKACDTADDEAFAHLVNDLLLSGHQVNMAHLQALTWGEELLAQ
jgi:EAL and modified HD-GYP domain-containing signal transduction protein